MSKRWYPGMVTGGALRPGCKSVPSGQPNCLLGWKFVLTGSLESLERNECKRLIEQYGGRVTGNVSGATDYLVTGEEAGEAKMRKARTKEVAIIDEDELLRMIATLPSRTHVTSNKRVKPSKQTNPTKPTKPTKQRNRASARPHLTQATRRADVEHATEATSASEQEPLTCAKHLCDSTSTKPTLQMPCNDTNLDASLWPDKYAPKHPSQVLGNQRAMRTLMTFLEQFPHVTKRGVLLLGPSGCGKTCAVYTCARALHYTVLELNSGDKRTRALLTKFATTLTTRCLPDANHHNKKLLLFDEIEGRCADRGGITQLTRFISTTSVPIVCTGIHRGSEPARALAKHCQTISFRAPQRTEVYDRLQAVARSEDLCIDPETMADLVERAHSDVRQALLLLQFWGRSLSLNVPATPRSSSFVDLRSSAPALFKALPRDRVGLTRRTAIYFQDPQMISLWTQENYAGPMNSLAQLAQASSLLSDGDVVDRCLRERQQWSLMPAHAWLSSVLPGSLVKTPRRTTFGCWLAKNAQRQKNQRALTAISNTGRLSNHAVREQCPLLRHRLVAPLASVAGIPSVLRLMSHYGWNADARRTILSLGQRLQYYGQRKCSAYAFEPASEVERQFVRALREQDKSIRRRARTKRKRVSSSATAPNKQNPSKPNSSASTPRRPKRGRTLAQPLAKNKSAKRRRSKGLHAYFTTLPSKSSFADVAQS